MSKEQITPHIYMFEVNAPAIAHKSLPGQFVIIRSHDLGERIPITIAGINAERGIVKIYVAEVGLSSKEVCKLEEGESILNFAGPLGNATKIEKHGKILIIGGAAFIGAQHYITTSFKDAGNTIESVLTARRSEDLFLVDEIKEISDKLYIVTEDGSKGYSSFDFLNSKLKEFDHVFTIGPMAMQKMIAENTKSLGIPTTVNLFPIMVDGTGMCGACRVSVGGTIRFACIDGPDFDGHQVDFEELISRMRYYTPQEKIAMVLNEKGVI
jgi:ferredoxin--NADP+ reductase